MPNVNNTKLFVVITFLSLAFVSTIGSFAQTKAAKSSDLLEPLPKGNWSIVFHPYLGEGYLNAPVIVQSVSSKRLAAEKFEIQNISNKSVKAIKVKWIVYENEDSNKILQYGRTSPLNFRNELPAGQMGFIRLRVVSFVDFYRNFLVNGRLDKELDISLLVDEVTFADGSLWRWEDGISSEINREIISKLNATADDCAKQKCVARPSTTVKDAVVYSCGASQSSERCVPSGDFACTNESCNRPGGGAGGGGGFEIILD